MLQHRHLGIEQGHGCPVDKAQGEDISCFNQKLLSQVIFDFSDGHEETSLISPRDECHTVIHVCWIKQTVCSSSALGCPKVVVLDLFVIHLCVTVFHHLTPRHKQIHIMHHPKLPEFELVFLKFSSTNFHAQYRCLLSVVKDQLLPPLKDQIAENRQRHHIEVLVSMLLSTS